MTDTLSEAGNAAGLRDPELLKLARTDVAPEQAIEQLRTRYPGAFESMAQVAAEYGLTDTAALAMVRQGVSPRQALNELKQHHPDAFKKPFDARTATPAERAAAWAKLQRDEFNRHANAVNAADMAKIEKRFGKKKD